eukprot:UN34552
MIFGCTLCPGVFIIQWYGHIQSLNFPVASNSFVYVFPHSLSDSFFVFHLPFATLSAEINVNGFGMLAFFVNPVYWICYMMFMMRVQRYSYISYVFGIVFDKLDNSPRIGISPFHL